MSPATRFTSGDPEPQPVLPLLNSKPMWADGDVVFCGMRTHASSRYVCPLTTLVARYTRFRSSLFGALAVITVGQLSSCFVPPANPLSLVTACASSIPLKTQPLAVLSDVRYGAVPVHDVVAKPFQSNVD